MSDTSDRLAFLNGSTELRRPFGEYPAPHSDRVSVSDQETASAQSDDFSDIFDWDLYAHHAATDVTTQSDVPSERKPAARPPLLRPAGPAATTHDIDGDCLMSDVGSQEPQPSNVWPIISDPTPPRDLSIHLEASPSPSPFTEDQGAPSGTPQGQNSAEMHLVGQPQTASSPSQKKTRIVKSPEETSQVRDIKACYHCKMNKSKCDASPVCQPCKKQPFPELACIRTPPLAILGSVLSRWNWNDPEPFKPGRVHFGEGRPFRLFICFSESVDSPCLEVTARSFMPSNQKDHRGQGIQRLGILPEEGPSEDMFYRWAKQQIRSENSTDFEAQMDKFFLLFVSRTGNSHGQHMEKLLADLLKMRYMWKIWSCKQLFVRPQPGSPQVSSFTLPLAPVQDFLRLFAAQKISELEWSIVSNIDTHLLNKKDSARGVQPLRSRLDITKWLLLWQLILMYRQSLRWMLQQEQTNAAPIHIAVMPMSARRHNFRDKTMELLNAMIVIYSEVFHKSTTVEGIRDAGPAAFGNDLELHILFQRARQALPEFYNQVLRQVSPMDELFKERIVRKETKILEKGRPAQK